MVVTIKGFLGIVVANKGGDHRVPSEDVLVRCLTKCEVG